MSIALSRGTHIALLRGINVGGKNRLPMKDLAAMFAESGCTDVRTYIQSGNVVFTVGPKLAGRVPGLIAKAIGDHFGLDIPVITRTAAEMAKVARNNPFIKDGTDKKLLHVAFLMDRPGKQRIAALDPDRSPPDEFALRGSEIYVKCPNGIARTKLTTQYFDSRLKTTITVRNWNTVLRLVELAKG